ncbi:NTP transferase domain-containing protein [Paracrocinitomix mangrovi]|uniref:sugar phosphate nucleotidyltransferase n=1 Tax=Paracrocinitomix mangrovi TaxID=2862509 RepID=UPI001C8D195A|nr:sugar phosphate nucleotidyltransferase [Paracrocinitomix mangrovi]UKN00814.1 NTP transferase domain-containing protein [Paracrocinitomix mangrovi]
MKIVVPMAGRGSRLRPHTLTVPKPLIPVGGKPIVHRLVEDIAKTSADKVTEIGFIIGDFGKEVEQELLAVAETLGAKGKIFYQEEALGTAHAVLCAEEMLDGPVVVAFADTLFRADFTMSPDVDGVLWVKQIDDPSAFGVVKLDAEGTITDFVEKPKEFVSDLAMIGIYYFKEAEKLRTELKYLIDNNIIKGGEYQLPDALRRLTEKGTKFKPGEVNEWLDCGNKAVTVFTNQRVLEFDKDKQLVSDKATINNSVIIPPCYIGDGAVIKNSVIGPHVSVGAATKISGSVIVNSIIQKEAEITNANIKDSMIGNKAAVLKQASDISIGDFTTID